MGPPRTGSQSEQRIEMSASPTRSDAGYTLRVNELSKSHGSSVALSAVSFDIREGEILGVIGPSGSGKTTLLRCIDLLDIPDSGSIEYFGQLRLSRSGIGEPPRILNLEHAHDGDITEDNLRCVRRNVGLVFQNFNLWEDKTVLENLILAPVVVARMDCKTAERKAKDLCGRFELEHRIQAHAWQLSGGERQRVSILRALMMEPKLMLLDEVTSALDPLLTFSVMKAIAQLRDQGLSMIVVTHHLEFASSLCDRLLYLENGKVIQIAAPADFRRAPATERVRDFLKVLQATG